jgi:hypothetical protein
MFRRTLLGRDVQDRADQLGRDPVLRHVPGGPGDACRIDVLTRVGTGDDQHADRRIGLDDAPGRLEPTDAGHRDVHQHEVGPELARQPDRILAGGGQADDVDPPIGGKDRLEGFGEQAMVIDDQNTD